MIWEDLVWGLKPFQTKLYKLSLIVTDLYSTINLVFAIDTGTSESTWAAFLLCIFKPTAFLFPHTDSCPTANYEDQKKEN